MNRLVSVIISQWRLAALLLLMHDAMAYRIIAPVAFQSVNKNYIKLQILSEPGDATADSAFFDILYNSGISKIIKLDQSLSHVLPLNDFNDGVFYVQAKVFADRKVIILGSKYNEAGIPILLDRNPRLNSVSYTSKFQTDRQSRDFSEGEDYTISGNNNVMAFQSTWDMDSLYFHIRVEDANLNYTNPITWDLFNARDYLKVLWNSDCIEIGLDLLHNHSEWKETDDWELVIDVKGNRMGYNWNVIDSVYNTWGSKCRVSVLYQGTINNNQDQDEGYQIDVAIPWRELNFIPKEDQSIGFDIQLYDKDAELDESFRVSLSGTNPESNDNTSEWANLEFRKNSGNVVVYAATIAGLLITAVAIFFLVRRTDRSEASDTPVFAANKDVAEVSRYTRTALRFISEHYTDAELTRHQIADKVAVSEKYLSSLFKKEMGINLVAYINRFRIEKSVELLQKSQLSISEIAFSVGYNSLQNFNKNFKAQTGKTPSEFRG